MKNLLMDIWQDESGAETAEWLVVVSLILVVAVAIYTLVLQGVLTDVAAGITATLTAAGIVGP